MKLTSLLSILLGTALEAIAQTATPNPWFSGEMTLVPGSSSSLLPPGNLPNILIGNADGSQGAEWSFEAGVNNATARATSFINLSNGNWRWGRLNPDATLQTTEPWKSMELSPSGVLTLNAPVPNMFSPGHYVQQQIIIDPVNKRLLINGSPVLTSNGSNYNFGSDRFNFGTGLSNGGPSQTVLGRYNTSVTWDAANSGGDPLLVVGGGISSSARSNALVLRANGDAAFSGRVSGAAAALGTGLSSNGPSQTVLGRYNTAVTWDAANPAGDPLLVVGGGANSSARANAMVLAANGDVTFSGKISAGPNYTPGANTVALGYGLQATQEAAVAMGIYSNAQGKWSASIGVSNQVTGDAAVAMGGWNAASSYAANAFGGGSAATGVWSFAAGSGVRASGNASVAMGYSCLASGNTAVAFGYSTASGDYSTALGVSTASAPYAVSMGAGSIASGYSQAALGKFNAESPNAVFIVGNGTDENVVNRKNAFEVRADGSAYARVLRVPPAGDLSMNGFEAGPRPLE